MQVELGNHTCTVTRESGDPKLYGGGWGDGESRLLYHVKLALIAQGYDVIKKRIQKDGHMMGDEFQQYIRTHNQKDPNGFSIYSGFYAIKGANEVYNQAGKVCLMVSRWND